MSVALRSAIASAQSRLRSAASAFFSALSRTVASRSASPARPRRRVLDGPRRRLHRLHLRPDVVDLPQLLGRKQTVRDHRAVDQLRPEVVGRRDHAPEAEGEIAEEVFPLRFVFNLLVGDRQVVARVERVGRLGRGVLHGVGLGREVGVGRRLWDRRRRRGSHRRLRFEPEGPSLRRPGWWRRREVRVGEDDRNHLGGRRRGGHVGARGERPGDGRGNGRPDPGGLRRTRARLAEEEPQQTLPETHEVGRPSDRSVEEKRGGPPSTSRQRPRAFTEPLHACRAPGTSVDSARGTAGVPGQKNNALGEAISGANSAAAERRGGVVSTTTRLASPRLGGQCAGRPRACQ